MRPRLSIVVPFYNVERYIGDCLVSLQNQTMRDFEVILVDDGSFDESHDLAKAFCQADHRFRMVRQENAGLGPARNTGIAHAQAEYLAFVDSDDLVPSRAYEQMVRSLEQSGSDMVSGDARRFNDLGVRDSYVHVEPFATQRIATHVREFPALALDRMAWNKVVSRRFWDDHGFAFPAMLYEDYPVTIKLHVLARQVDVLSSPVYLWREREGGELSITQRKWELRNLRDRAESAALVLDFLHEQAPEVAPVVEQHLLHIDVSAIAAALHENDPAEHPAILELAERIYRRTSDEARRKVIPFERIQNNLLERHRLPELKQLMDYRARNGVWAPVRRTGFLRRNHHLQLPLLDDAASQVPSELYEVPQDHVRLQARVRDAAWRDGQLHVDLFTAINGLPMTERAKVTVWLEAPKGVRSGKVALPVVDRYAIPRPLFGQDLCGTRVVIDPARLGSRGRAALGHWRMHVQVKASGVKLARHVSTVDPGRARWAPSIVLDDLVVQAEQKPNGFGVAFRRPLHRVTAVERDHQDLVVRGTFTAPELDPAPVLRLWAEDGSAELSLDATATTRQGNIHEFEARIPAGALIGHERTSPVEERVSLMARLRVHGQPKALAVVPGTALAHVTTANRRLSSAVSHHGNLMLHEAYAHPLVQSAAWARDHVLVVGGVQDRVREQPASLLVRRYVTPADRVDVRLPLVWDGDRFQTRVDVDELAAAADAVRTGSEGHAATPWELLMDYADGPDPAWTDTASLQSMADPRTVGGHQVRIALGRMGRLHLLVE